MTEHDQTPFVFDLDSLPRGVAWLRKSEQGREWLRSLPRLAKECADNWGLTIGEPLEDAFLSLPLLATLSGGGEAVLKIQFPHPESEHEAAALELWNGVGAVRLFAHDVDRHALLLERCEPGTYLSQVDQSQALDIFIDLLPRLWKPAGSPFTSLEEEALGWANGLTSKWESHGRPCDRELLDLTIEALVDLSQSQGEQVLLHQDLHGNNVLSAQREPWLAIDPKPLAGEREFAVAPIVRSKELGTDRRHVIYRFDRLTAELGLDRERARQWTIAQTLAWGLDREWHIHVASWLAAR
jgi:streptomycin 6-kinase